MFVLARDGWQCDELCIERRAKEMIVICSTMFYPCHVCELIDCAAFIAGLEASQGFLARVLYYARMRHIHGLNCK